MTFPVFLDTCTLFGEVLCDLMLRLAEHDLLTPYWSDDILKELHTVLVPRIGNDKASYRIDAMRQGFPEAVVSGYSYLVDSMNCAEEDRHVLAATIRSPARTLATFNVVDFPKEATASFDIDVRHPDHFLIDLFNRNPTRVLQTCQQTLHGYRLYPQTPQDYAVELAKAGVPKFAETIYPALDALY